MVELEIDINAYNYINSTKEDDGKTLCVCFGTEWKLVAMYSDSHPRGDTPSLG